MAVVAFVVAVVAVVFDGVVVVVVELTELTATSVEKVNHNSHDSLRVGSNDFGKKKLFEPTLNKSHELWLAFLLCLTWLLSAQQQPQPTSSDTTTAITTIDSKLPSFFYIFFYIISILIFCFSYNNYFKFGHLNSLNNNYNVGYDCHNSIN